MANEDNAPQDTQTSNPKAEIIAPPVLRENPTKNKQEIAYKRRMELMDVVKVIGFKAARKQYKTWAKHYGINERNVYLDFDWIKGNFKPGDLQEVKIDLRVARDRALEGALGLLQEANNVQDKSRAISTLISVSKVYREEIEAWGEKEKVADKIDFQGTTINLITKSLEEIKNAKRDQSADQPEATGNPPSA